jgi:hypothetical protein
VSRKLGGVTGSPLLDHVIEVFGADPEAPGAQPDDQQRAGLPQGSDVADGDVEDFGDLTRCQEPVLLGFNGHRGPLEGQEVRYGANGDLRLFVAMRRISHASLIG